jgi:hypothetical protein
MSLSPAAYRATNPDGECPRFKVPSGVWSVAVFKDARVLHGFVRVTMSATSTPASVAVTGTAVAMGVRLR